MDDKKIKKTIPEKQNNDAIGKEVLAIVRDLAKNFIDENDAVIKDIGKDVFKRLVFHEVALLQSVRAIGKSPSLDEILASEEAVALRAEMHAGVFIEENLRHQNYMHVRQKIQIFLKDAVVLVGSVGIKFLMQTVVK